MYQLLSAPDKATNEQYSLALITKILVVLIPIFVRCTLMYGERLEPSLHVGHSGTVMVPGQ